MDELTSEALADEAPYAPRLMACGAWHEHPAHDGCLGVGKDDALARFMKSEE